jgi:hypothetical protein
MRAVKGVVKKEEVDEELAAGLGSAGTKKRGRPAASGAAGKKTRKKAGTEDVKPELDKDDY